MKSEEEIRERLEELRNLDHTHYRSGKKKALEWVLEE